MNPIQALTRRLATAAGTAMILAATVQVSPAHAGMPPPARLAKAMAKAQAVAGHLKMAQLALEAKEYTLAADACRRALKEDPKHADARKALVLALGRSGQIKEALPLADALAKEFPNDGWVAQTRAGLYLASGDKAKALAVLEEMIAKPGAPIAARYFAARLLDDKRKAGDAAAGSRQRAHLAAYLADKGGSAADQVDDAERMAFEIDFGDIGQKYWQARKAFNFAFTVGGMQSVNAIAQAEQTLKQILLAKPDFQLAHSLLGACFATVKSRNYDLNNAAAALKRAPQVADAQFMLGRVYRELDKLDDAAQAFEKAIALDGRHVEAGYQLGVAYKLLKKRELAVKVLEQVVRIKPESAAAARALAELQVLAPQSQFVLAASQRVDAPGDDKVFNTERYRASIVALEKTWMGGIEEGADVLWLEKIMRRLIAANDLPVRVPFRVKLGKTMMINCFAAPHGDIYVTRGFLQYLKKGWPAVALDEHNAYMAGVMAHEMVHVIRNHVVNRESFRMALTQTGAEMSPEQLRLTTRMSEIEADREGLLYMLAAGYNPNALVEWMEKAAADIGDPPPAEDHPTFDERVGFLMDFWTNEVRFAWQAFDAGTQALEEAGKLETTDLAKARRAYDTAINELDRYTRYFRQSKEAWNNLAIAQAKLGVLDQADKSPLGKWYTPLSIEQKVAQQLPKVERKKRGDKTDVVFLERAKESLQRALDLDGNYHRALINLAAVQTGLRDFDGAKATLARAQAAGADKVLVSMLHGILHGEQGQWPQAVSAFTNAARESGDHPRALFCLALALQGNSEKDKAKEAYAAFLAKESKGSPWAAVAQLQASALAATP